MSEVGRPITPVFRCVVILTVLGFCGVGPVWAQAKTYGLTSPNGSLSLKVDVGKKILWSARKGDQVMIEPSAISLQIADGPVLGNDSRVVSHKTDNVDT
jgi:alpha-glucosidase